MSVVKPKPKQLLHPITTDTNIAMSQSEYEANSCNGRKARENACVQVAICFGFVFHWLKTWREFCWPITRLSWISMRWPGFKSRSGLSLVLFWVSAWFNSSVIVVYSQLVCLTPVGIVVMLCLFVLSMLNWKPFYLSFLPGFSLCDLFYWSDVNLLHSCSVLGNYFLGHWKLSLVMLRFVFNEPIGKTFIIKRPSKTKCKS